MAHLLRRSVRAGSASHDSSTRRFLVFAFQVASNRSPINGTAPNTVSTPMLSSIRVSTDTGARSLNASISA